jgi:hypothetical protein
MRNRGNSGSTKSDSTKEGGGMRNTNTNNLNPYVAHLEFEKNGDLDADLLADHDETNENTNRPGTRSDRPTPIHRNVSGVKKKKKARKTITDSNFTA